MGARKGKRPRKAAAGPKRRVLGNDPFERGAAVREVATPTATPTPTPTSTATGTPTPIPTAAPPPGGDTDYAREIADLARSLLPALQERLRSLVGLLRLGEAAGPLDPHGMDPTLLGRAAPLLDFLYLSWWRVEAAGAASLPEGPLVLVANHGGALPWDALVLRLAVRRETPSHRDLRPLLDAAALARPLAGRIAARLGAVAATPENGLRLLAEGAAVGVFPEGSATRPWPRRYRIGPFGRGGFVKLALRAGAAVVPCAIVGSEEASPPVDRAGFLADALRMPLLGNLPGLPIGPLGGLPLPARWKLRFGEPLDLAGLGPASAEDPAVVARLAGTTRQRLQALLDEELAARRSVYL
jgi:1-acyl-sn-glycerol-3-phosphate acyltransferase